MTAMSRRQAEKIGIEKDDPTGKLFEPVDRVTGKKMPARLLMPDKGFMSHPGKAHYKPDLSKYPADLRQKFLEHMLAKACPADWMDFADSPCLARLKRHLKQEDLKRLETLVWAKSKENQESFGKWVERVLTSRQAKGELHPAGNLPDKVLRKLQKQPELALVVVTDKDIMHMSRPSKKRRSQTFTAQEIADIPNRFESATWYRDKQDPGLLMTWIREGDKELKVVIRTDRKIGKGKTNQIVTSGSVEKHNIENDARYEKL